VNQSQPIPNFTGLWEVKLERSSLHGEPPRQMLVNIEHFEPNLVQTVFVALVSGAHERLRFAYTTDGEKSINVVRGMRCETHAHWEGAELVIESLMKTPGREFHFKDHWSLSHDGQTLTMTHRDDDLAGQISVLEKAPQLATKFLEC